MKKNRENNQQEAPQNRAEQAPDNKLPIDFTRRNANRALDTESLLALLRKDAPQFFELAEVVGKWVWIQFPEKQPTEVTKELSELGFHWNNLRQTWQHPCGSTRDERPKFDPRKRYGTHSAGEQKAA